MKEATGKEDITIVFVKLLADKNEVLSGENMTKQQEEAVKYIEAQLEDGYIDLGINEQDELEIIKEAIFLWKSTNRISIEDWKRLGYTDEEAEELMEASKKYR